MPLIHIERIPDDVYEILVRRAGEAGHSLEEYLRQRLVEDARRPTLDEVFRRGPAHCSGDVPLADGTKAVRLDRHER
jgi:hypothetical protein